jgi:two-component system, NarL family, sensor histidine kinase UhpB
MLRTSSLRARLSMLLGGVIIAGLVLGIGLLILHAGARVRAEAEGATRLARELVEASLLNIDTTADPKSKLSPVIDEVRRLRHVRITIDGVAPAPVKVGGAPEWFSRLVFRPPAPAHLSSPFGVIDIAADPSDEISEIWEEIVWLTLGATTVATLAFGLVSYAVSRTLAPIGALSDALQRIENGDFTTRAPKVGSPEFVLIAERINSLGATLARLDAENRQLIRRMIHVQDEERRDIARDLHDDIGPFLFTVRAGMGALARKLTDPDANPSALAEGCARIDSQIAALQQVNRRILGRLRPAALEEMGLADALEVIARGWRETHPEIRLDVSLNGARDVVDEATALTAYRVAQEGLSNAYRHSGAGAISLVAKRTGEWLQIEVTDDGVGRQAIASSGLGLQGMSERVAAIGGTLTVNNEAAGGVRLGARLRIAPQAPSRENFPNCSGGFHTRSLYFSTVVAAPHPGNIALARKPEPDDAVLLKL